jgi:hypothetical protein
VSNIGCGRGGAEHNRHDMTDEICEKVGSDTRDHPQSTTKAVRPQKSPATAGFRTFAGAAPTHLGELPSSKQGFFWSAVHCSADQRLPRGWAAGIGRRPRVACCHFYSETKSPTNLLFKGGETLFSLVVFFKKNRARAPGQRPGSSGAATGGHRAPPGDPPPPRPTLVGQTTADQKTPCFDDGSSSRCVGAAPAKVRNPAVAGDF